MRPEDYRSSHLGKGNEYHSIFTEKPHTAMLWTLEQRVLQELLDAHFPSERPTHLDFACGTGRVLSALAPRCRRSVGVDVSESMLGVAQTNNPNAELVLVDLTRENILEGQTFDLVTAFRFFPNAEDSLRLEALSVLTKLLSPRGVLIFNNHMNSKTLYRGVLRLTGRPRGHGMSLTEVEDLVATQDLKITDMFGLGSMPLNDKYMFAPQLVARGEWALNRMPGRRRYAQDQIFAAVPRV